MSVRRSVTVLILLLMAVASDAADPPAAAPVRTATAASSPGRGQPHHAPRFRTFVDMQTFMDHVLTPAATVVWRSNGFVNDAAGDHDLAPQTDADWEAVVSGAATLAEATNALRIPQRRLDAAWDGYVERLATAAARAYEAAEKHDRGALAEVSDHLDEICSSCHRHYGYE